MNFVVLLYDGARSGKKKLLRKKKMPKDLDLLELVLKSVKVNNIRRKN